MIFYCNLKSLIKKLWTSIQWLITVEQQLINNAKSQGDYFLEIICVFGSVDNGKRTGTILPLVETVDQLSVSVLTNIYGCTIWWSNILFFFRTGLFFQIKVKTDEAYYSIPTKPNFSWDCKLLHINNWFGFFFQREAPKS